MLHLNNKHYRSSDHNIVSIYKLYRKNGGKLTRLDFSKIVTSYGKATGEYICNTGNLVRIPYLGTIGFIQISSVDNYIYRDKPNIDLSKKYKYWLEQDEKQFHEIDDALFYTDKARIKPFIRAYQKMTAFFNIRFKTYDIVFTRNISRTVRDNFEDGMFLPVIKK